MSFLDVNGVIKRNRAIDIVKGVNGLNVIIEKVNGLNVAIEESDKLNAAIKEITDPMDVD